ncbi:RAM signaling pathway protein-domain-containing protein [Sparassis latifolia]|uniref:RAM signaling network component n=1 Tax=Sparassis crispa TaxID=139825 RepID=A0A401GIS4_9APHY|nr:predicted protein [Sparassis crispa]GBE82072.1 predicted protein [Sparassis crispa]
MSSSDVETSSGRPSLHTLTNGVPSPLPSISFGRDHINEALSKSPDKGATLDLANKGLTDVGEYGAEELATIEADSPVVRIALAYNRLTTLPMAFALLSHLRYLVLKNNNFAVFPDVLTVMPSLEILDISRNKIKRFPSQPGSLVKLRVFSIFRNKLHRLPSYLCDFKELTLFKVERNPLEWPPKHVLESNENLDDPRTMSKWIRSVQTWIAENAPPSERKMSEDSLHHDLEVQEVYADATMDMSFDLSPLPTDAISPRTNSYHTRSISLESEHSTYFQLDGPPSGAGPSSLTRPDMLPRLHLSPIPPGVSSSTSTSPSRSPQDYPATPDQTVSTNENAARKSSAHTRNVSFADGGYKSSRSAKLAKKSLPDLRPAVSPQGTSRDGGGTASQHVIPAEANGLSSSRNATVLIHDPLSASPLSMVDRTAPSMDVERNSYFRRLSALTPASLAKTIPNDLLALVDAIRSILFALSQVYQALQYYTVYAIDERLSAVLLKVLDPASMYMTQLIQALDRFDSMSRISLPPPSVCRAVVEGCRDNVAVFGKVVGVLALQLKVLATHDDVRYTRQMLLVLYGAMAEISGAWQAIGGRIEAVKPLLRETRPSHFTKSHTAQLQTSRAATVAPSMDISRQPSSAPPMSSSSFLPIQEQPRIHLRSNTQGSVDMGTTRARRQAGSFSSKDVEIGKMLPSYVEPPPLTAGILNGTGGQTPVLRTIRRLAVPPDSTPSSIPSLSPDQENPPAAAVPAAPPGWDTHSRQGSQSSIIVSSSSPAISFREAPSSASTLVDKEVIQAMKMAVEAAPAIWEMMDEILHDAQEARDDLKDTLQSAREVTERLRENMGAIRDGALTVEGRPLHDDAHIFIKNVIQLSNAIKTHGAAHPLSSTLRTNMVKLTNATQEFVILLHVSSFSPATTPRPYSPMVGVMAQPSPLGLPEDGRLGANLSRSRSALRATNLKVASTLKRPPHSALPHQTFTIPNPPRFGSMRDAVEDSPAVQA